METKEEVSLKSENFCGTLCFFLSHSTREICRRSCYFVISLLSCYLAITVALVANTVISNSPLLFLRISEISQAEIDLTIEAERDTSTFKRYLNSTKMSELVGNAALLTPRIVFPATFVIDAVEEFHIYSLIALDSEREAELEIGRNYKNPPLNEGECAIYEDLASMLKITKGDEITILIPDNRYFNVFYAKKGIITETNIENFEKGHGFYFKCKVGLIYDSLEGKVPSGDEEGCLYMELKHFLKSMSKAVSIDVAPYPSLDFLKDENPYDVVTEVHTNHPNRMKLYKDSNYDNIKEELITFSEAILQRLGFFPVSTDMPILSDLESYSMAAVFLGIVMNLVVIVLAAISSYLVYSLLMISFDTRIFEMGMFRLIGIRKYFLCLLVLIQALLFVLPALILGIGTSFLYLWLISMIFDNSIQFSFTPVPSGGAFIWAICVGFIIPLLAALIPMIDVLNKSLSKSIDMEHSKSQGVHITVEYASKKTNWALVVFGLVIIVFGLLVYYMLPLSFLLMDFQLMLWILIIVLLALFIGLIMIAMNIHHFLELFIIYVLLFLETAYMKMVIAKNLVAHRIRNRRTGITFSVVIGFLIFIIVAYTLELENNRLSLLKTHGAYLDLYVKTKHGSLSFEDVIKYEQALADHKDIIDGFTWLPQQLNLNPHLKLRKEWVSDYASQNRYAVVLMPIAPNFFDVSNKEFLTIDSKNKTSDLPIAEQLYTTRGSQALGVGSFLKRELGVTATDPDSTFLLRFDRLTDSVAFESRALFMLSTCPMFQMSRLTKNVQNSLLSYPLYLKFTNASSPTSVNYWNLLIKAKKDKTEHLDKLHGVLKKVSENVKVTVTLWTYSDSSEDIDTINRFLDIIFIIIIILFMLLFAFSLISSMTANVLEQVKELAVMRAVGMTKGRAAILYMYEAFVLVLASSIIGAIIGVIVGFTLCLQRGLYTNLPIIFKVPWVHLLVIVGASLLCAAISSISPAIFILTNSIAILAKS